MVSLARYVRAGSAERNTQQLLRTLEERLAAQPTTIPSGDTGSGSPPVPLPNAPESAWLEYAGASNATVRRLLGVDEIVCDAWGNPIAYFRSGRRTIGTAPRDRPFCVSSGPDGRFLTQQDNLYSYEQLLPAAGPPRQDAP